MKRDQIILALVFAALAFVILHKLAPQALPDVSTADDDTGSAVFPDTGSRGPSYLTYNMPWSFGPPVQNIMPSVVQTNGVATSTVNAASNGCDACGGT